MYTMPILPKESNFSSNFSIRMTSPALFSKGLRMTAEPNKGKPLDIFLFGPLCVVGPSACNLAPKNQKSKAVLAMLALAPRGSRSRVWLRDKLWSDRREDQASASLRQALLDIRKSLGADHKDIIHSEKYSVTLDLSRVRVDVIEFVEALENGGTCSTARPDATAEHFLEGFDICDPEFESWLTLERQIWEQRFDNTAPTPALAVPAPLRSVAQNGSLPPPGSQSLALPGRTGIAKANSWAVGAQVVAADQSFASFLDSELAENMHEMGRIPILRLLQGQPLPDPADGFDVPIIVRTSEIQQGETVKLTIDLLTGDQGISVWSINQTFSIKTLAEQGGAAISGMVAQAVIQIGRHLQVAATQPGMVMAGQLIECIYQIFDLSPSKLSKAEETLTALLKTQPDAKAYAWMAFAKSFQIGQRFSPDAVAQISEAHYFASRALEEDEYDPLVLSLAAHIHSYLFSEFDHAASLYERALKIDPRQAIGWDLYATMHAYTGHNGKSLAMASWGQHLGGNTPLSYYFDTTKCMAAALFGQHEVAIQAGQKALTQRPEFNSILRYLISSHAHLDNVEEVDVLRAKLHAVEPDFSTDVLRAAGYPGLSTEGGRQFLDGLRKAGFDSKS
jgi:tetratricopeptide (TPR) repeat protein